MERGMIVVETDRNKLFERAAHLIAESAHQAIARSGRFSLVLTGGNTPRDLYQFDAVWS